MRQTTSSFQGRQNLRLVYDKWQPSREPKGLVFMVHGYAEHRGRYQHVIEALTARGYLGVALDHRGHGESEGERACVETFDYFVDDLQTLVKKVKGEHSRLPYTMIGHSMGGLIAKHYALRYESELDHLVLSGPALQIGDDVSPLLKKVSKYLVKLIPTRAILPIKQNVLSRDPEVERRFEADPLCYSGRVKVRQAHEMMMASEDAQKKMARLQLPLLIMHGTADRLTNPAGSQRLYEQAQSKDKTLKLWQDSYHEIFNEPNKEDVIRFTLDWLDERVP